MLGIEPSDSFKPVNHYHISPFRRLLQNLAVSVAKLNHISKLSKRLLVFERFFAYPSTHITKKTFLSTLTFYTFYTNTSAKSVNRVPEIKTKFRKLSANNKINYNNKNYYQAICIVNSLPSPASIIFFKVSSSISDLLFSNLDM